MKVYIRADSSNIIGSGHIMRCLTLAQELRSRNAAVSFLCKNETGNLSDLVRNQGFDVIDIASDARIIADAEFCQNVIQDNSDLLIVDHYKLDRQWEERLRSSTSHLAVIDDLANRPHHCDLLLDQNLYSDLDSRYNGLVPGKCKKLLGPRYALLRNEFFQAREKLKPRHRQLNRVLVFFGGADAADLSSKTLEALKDNSNIIVDLVVGSSNDKKKEIASHCAQLDNVNYHCQINNISELIAAADLAFGAAGSNTWERCALGLASVIISANKHEVPLAKHSEECGFAVYLGAKDEVSVQDIASILYDLSNDNQRLQKMSEIALATVDAKGAARVAKEMLSLLKD